MSFLSFKRSKRPFRIGIYEITLAPNCGIGVFVYNLVAGLLELEEAATKISSLDQTESPGLMVGGIMTPRSDSFL
jgi:hypothetical protein